jgi:hypothetical protein
LTDSAQRYQQVLGAYHRTNADNVDQSAAPRTAYVRLAARSRRRHDGFYFRFAGGIGSGNDSMKSDKSLPTNATLSFEPDPLDGSGSALAAVTEIAFGYAVWPGITLGGGIYTATLPKLTATVKDFRTGSYDFDPSQLVVFGPVVDWYVNPDTGFHVQGSPGVASYVAGGGEPRIEGPGAQAHAAIGFGFMLGLGYEWWIADQWSLGFLGRLTYGATSGTDNRAVGWTHSTVVPAVLVSATYQ